MAPYDLTTFLDSRAEICQIFRGIFGKSKISRGHSESIWPLKSPICPTTKRLFWVFIVLGMYNWNIFLQTHCTYIKSVNTDTLQGWIALIVQFFCKKKSKFAHKLLYISRYVAYSSRYVEYWQFQAWSFFLQNYIWFFDNVSYVYKTF